MALTTFELNDDDFKEWLLEQPEGMVIAKMWTPETCPIANWYCARNKKEISVYGDRIAINDKCVLTDYTAPSWVEIFVSNIDFHNSDEGVDKHTCLAVLEEAKEELEKDKDCTKGVEVLDENSWTISDDQT